jgi:2-C-methyl-D-erythritol 4-phosphate cytidylyltransferase
MKTIAIILAGGSGLRFNNDLPKQYIVVNNKTILEHTLKKFQENSSIDEIIVALNDEHINQKFKDNLVKSCPKISTLTKNGSNRRLSIYNALSAIKDDNCNVLVHNSTCPLVADDVITRCVTNLGKYDAVYPAIPMSNTILKHKDGFVDKMPSRKDYMLSQTPQGFKYEVLKKAHELAKNNLEIDELYNNDIGIIWHYNLCKVKIIEGNRENIKLTFPEDLILFEALIGTI